MNNSPSITWPTQGRSKERKIPNETGGNISRHMFCKCFSEINTTTTVFGILLIEAVEENE